ncbi:MAG: glycosyltransferase [Paludibacter sp.]|nr:glycosyltransferase [Paludibacter sp.]
MKILQIIPSLATGGAERLVVDLCNELTNQGQEVVLCITQNPQKSDYGFYLHELNNSVRFISLNQRKGFLFKNIIALQKIIKEVKPDVVHVHLSILLYVYILSFLNINIRFYNTIHSLAEKTCKNLFFKITNYFFYSLRFIKVITISEECKDSYEFFYKLKNSTLINNGRKTNLPSGKYQEVSDEMNVLKINKFDLLFIHVARYHKQKNQEMLIQVFNRLAKEGIRYSLLIIGDWSFCEDAKELAKRANNQIHFLGTKQDVCDYLYLADAFCLTSIYEGMPISLLEALSCGCTPICTPAGGIKDIIQDGITGFLSTDESAENYYKVLNNFIKQPNTLKKEVLIRHFKDNYSIEHCALKHIQLYQSNSIR